MMINIKIRITPRNIEDVTGSTGTTQVGDMLAHVFEVYANDPYLTEGNYRNHIFGVNKDVRLADVDISWHDGVDE